MLRSIQQLNGTTLGTCDGDIGRVSLILNYEQSRVCVASPKNPPSRVPRTLLRPLVRCIED
jgi:hypothetical protein